MTQIGAERGSPELPKRSMLASGLTVGKQLLWNPSIFKRLVVMGPDEPRYVRPPRTYKLPEYRQGMRRCISNEKYLRPTRWCNPREPLVVAMAHELGAYELSDWEFADAAYWWVKTNIESELLPLDSVSATLRRGTGTCMHATGLWIALCRAAGIKARYKEFKTMMDDVAMRLDAVDLMGLGGTAQALIPRVLNTNLPVLEGEAYIDGRWVVADAGQKPELYAQYGAPILKLGEDAMGLVLKPSPEPIRHFESLPWIFGITLSVTCWFAPVVIERVNVVHAAPLGKKIIEEAGGIEVYDQRVRKRKELMPEEKITEAMTRLTKDAKQRQVLEFEA
jgi:hypothetical protein